MSKGVKPVCAPVIDRAAYAASNIRVLRRELEEIRKRGPTMSTSDWDAIEEILEEIAKQNEIVTKARTDPLEEWCANNPSDAECLVYDL